MRIFAVATIAVLLCMLVGLCVDDAEARPRWRRSVPMLASVAPDASAPDANADAAAPDALSQSTRLMVSLSGQSQMVGSGGTPVISTDAGFDNYRRSDGGAVPLVEVTVESPASGLANWMASVEPGRDTIVDNWAVGGTAYSGLADGTAPYINGQAGVTVMRNWVAAARPGETLRCVFAASHGETDQINGTSRATYAANMATWQSDFQTDANAILSTSEICPLFLNQPNNGGVATSNSATMYNTIGAAISDAARANPTLIFNVGPTYHLAHESLGQHRTAAAHHREGEYFGRFIWDTIVRHNPIYALRPSNIACVDNVITVTMEGGDGSSLVIDTTNMPAKPHYGFEYTDGQNDVPVITGVALDGTREVEITLNRNCAADGRVRYAYYQIPQTTVGPANVSAPGGNIRDSDASAAILGAVPLYNWLETFDRPLDSQSGSASAEWTFSNTQSAAFDNGVASMAERSALNGATAVTLMYWYRSDGATANGTIWSMHALNQRVFAITTRSSGSLLRVFFAPGLTLTSAFADYSGIQPSAAWHHYAIVYNAGTVSVYYDSVLTAPSSTSGTFPSALTTGSTSDVAFGGTSGVGASDFNIAHAAAWYSYAASAADVLEAYTQVSGDPIDLRNASFGCPDDYWHFQGSYENVGCLAGGRNGRGYSGTSFEATAP